MRTVIDFIFWIVGMAVSCLIITGVITCLVEWIKCKLVDIKERKTIIEKGTIFFLDGKRVILKKDLTLRFKPRIYTECSCDEYKELPRGVQCGNTKLHKGWAKTNFETELLRCFKDFPNKFGHILEYQNKEDNK